MNNRETAERIIEILGGKNNITYATHCITRLRFNLKDDSKVQASKFEVLDGVQGYTVQAGQHQVIIGPKVKAVFTEVEQILGKLSEKSQQTEKKEEISISSILDVLTSIIAPVIPAFCACGMLKVVLLLLTSFGLAEGTEGAYQLFEMASDCAFYFLPILIAMSSAKRFNVDTGLAITLAGLLIYPSFTALVDGGGSLVFFGISVPMYTYSSTIFPALFGVYLLSKVYKIIDKIIKIDAIKLILVPLLSLAITAPITMLIVAPISNWLAEGLGEIFTWMIQTVGPLAGLVIGLLMPVMTLTGLHQSLTPVELFEMSSFGFSRILPIEFFHNLAEAGAALGNGVITKNKKWKAISYETGITALVGVSEPALYSVMVKDKRAMISAMIGNGIGGFLGVTFLVRGYAFVWPNIFSFASFMGEGSPMKDLLMLVICGVATFASAFIIRIILGNGKKNIEGKAYVSGKVIDIGTVNDNTFSKKTLGDGIAIVPNGNLITAPFDGTISAVMEESKHAVVMKLDNGAEIVIHAGIDTVGLNGEGFELFVKEGDKVKQGDKLITFNPDIIKRNHLDSTCVLVVTNSDEYPIKKVASSGSTVKNGTPVIKFN